MEHYNMVLAQVDEDIVIGLKNVSLVEKTIIEKVFHEAGFSITTNLIPERNQHNHRIKEMLSKLQKEGFNHGSIR